MSGPTIQPTLDYWNDLYKEVDDLVVRGEHGIVKSKLDKINPRSIPRSHAFLLAEIAWRASYPLFALKLLHPIVYPQNAFVKLATDKEKINYASALINLGAVDEALEIFDNINFEVEPEALLRRSFALFKKWEYKEAIPLLNKYIQHPQITPYKRVIGKVNLAAALVDQCDWIKSQELLSEIKTECLKNSYLLLLGNCLELQAQVQIYQLRFAQAIVILKEAQKYLIDQKGSFSLFVEKWLAICQCFEKNDGESLKDLRLLKKKAFELSNWESVRDCELFEGLATENQELVKKVLLGTPHESYRQRVRRLYGKNIVSRGNYNLILGENGLAQPAKVFSPYESVHGCEPLYKKPLLLSLFVALTTDFYKPSHVGLLFQRIYPEEKFNPFSSPKRVLMLIRRLNKWFSINENSLRVQFKKSEFCLISNAEQPVCVLIHRSKKLSKSNGQLEQLKELFVGRTFSIKQVSSKMGLSITTAKSLVLKELASGQLQKVTTSRPIHYKLVHKSIRKSAA